MIPPNLSDVVAGAGRAPGLVLLGAPRCGTTALAHWLHDAGLGVGVKDSFYLMDQDAGLRGPTHVSTHGVEGFLELFPETRRTTADCAAGYVYQRTALEFFKAWEVPPKFAIMVRDPVARLRSVHRYFAGNLGLLPSSMDFEAYVEALFSGSVPLRDSTASDALRQGRYATALEPWVEAFGSERVHVSNFDDLESSPAAVVKRLLELVGTEPEIELDNYPFESFNGSYVPRSAGIARATAWGRKRIPAGKLRSWGGERLRRLQVRGEGAPEGPALASSTHLQRLHDYYAAPNATLSLRHGIDVGAWT